MEKKTAFSPKQAIVIANKYAGHITNEQKLKKLSEEVVELAMGWASCDNINIEEEIGDVAFVLLHIAHKFNGATSLDPFISQAASKMVQRNTTTNGQTTSD